ncbi:MAG: hypothetical protein K9M03_02665 [Kiritimatiellales bacterium]|nr:hypothetical protein [Kiritimatiellales bacterium]
MNKLSRLSFGILALTTLLIPSESSAGIYDTIRGITSNEFGNVSDSVAGFVTHKQVFTEDITSSDVYDAMAYRSHDICQRRDTSAPCKIAQPIRDIANRENISQTLQRDLQLITLGYELPLSDHAIGPMQMATRMPSLIHIWQSSSDWLYTPITERRIRSQAFPTKEEDEELNKLVLGDPLDTANYPGIVGLLNTGGIYGDEELAQRYKWGLHTVREEDPKLEECSSWYSCEDWLNCWAIQDDDTEVRSLFMRGCDQNPKHSLEDVMQKVLDRLHETIVFDPPLQHGESVIFVPWKIKGEIFLWVHMNFSPEKDDIGLGNLAQIRPIMLNLECDWKNDGYGTPACMPGLRGDACYNDPTDECKKGIILGGMYLDPPREPPPTEKVCTMPFSSYGYMCRELDQTHCPPERDAYGNVINYDGITLTRCDADNLDSVVRTTESGWDACKLGGWRFNQVGYENDEGVVIPVNDTPEQDDYINRPFHCSNCAVDLFCSGEAEDENGNTIECINQASTYPKDENGVIKICLPETHKSNTYLLIHELIHAQQFCNQTEEFMERGLEDPEACCALEQPTYFAQCSLAAEDGHFEGTDMSVELCTSALINFSCLDRMPEDSDELPCTGDYFTRDEIDDLVDEIKDLTHQNLAGLPETCEDAINNMDPRVQMFRNSLPLVCSAECQAEYVNTIGNNACYIAQCTEESLETQRIIPGRMPFVSQDEAFPWESKAKDDPLIGSVMPIPPLPLTKIPSYKPELLVKEMDLALCQLSGLPILQPPHRCAFQALRQIALRPASTSLLGYGLVGQTSQAQEENWVVQNMASSIGARLGTTIYINYLERAGKAFWELVRGANELIGGISSLQFPNQSCKRYSTN